MTPLSDIELKWFREFVDSNALSTVARQEMRTKSDRLIDEMLFLRRELAKRNEQVAHLQNRGTELINETRMLKAKLHAARNVLTYHFIERPIDELGGALPPQSVSLMTLYQRLELLESTVATKVANVAGEFVKEVRDRLAREDVVGWHPDFVRKYVDKFTAILDA